MSAKTYTLGPIQQMIDLNGVFANFEAKFSARTQDGSPFFFTVADQAHLDSDQEITFHKAQGQVQDTIRMNTDVYQNVWLLLKADKECLCDISVQTVEIPPSRPVNEQPQKSAPALQANPNQESQLSLQQASHENSSKKSVNWILIVVIIGFAALALYLWYGQSNKGVNTCDIAPEPQSSPNIPEMQCSPDVSSSPGPSLMDRLNSLSIDAI